MGSFPYHSHIFRDSYGSGMGIVWEAYHKGVPLLGVPENPIDYPFPKKWVSSLFLDGTWLLLPPQHLRRPPRQSDSHLNVCFKLRITWYIRG